MNRIAVLIAAAAAAGVVSAQSPDGAPLPQVRFTEIFVNPPGTDGGFEGIELTGTPGGSLNGFFILNIDGDGTTTVGMPGAGGVDQVLNLNGMSLGSNGIFLWRDAATALNSGIPAVLLTGPNPATFVNVADFVPDLENGASTFILGYGTPPVLATSTDLDVDNDGVIDAGALAGFTVVDAIGTTDGGTLDRAYGASLGFTDIAAVSGGNNGLYRIPTCAGAPGTWASAFITGSSPGPFAMSGSQLGFPFAPGSSWTLDLGRPNLCVASLAFVNAGPGTALSIDVSGAQPGESYLTALTFNVGNLPTPPYTGPHAGLVIDLGELYTEAFTFTAPFFGVLDGGGASSFVVPDMPVLGMTLHGATLVFGGAFGDFIGRTSVVSLAL